MPPKGSKLSEESKDKIREARKKQIHPQFVKHGVTAEMLADAQAKGIRWCCGCKEFHPVSEFSGPRRPCRKQVAENVQKIRDKWTAEERAANAENIKLWRGRNISYEKRYRLLLYYGVSPEWYDEKLAEQGGVCELCFSATPRTGSKHFCVDHNHTTGKVRGLLCAKCNTALERFDSDPDWPTRAVAYLQKYS